MAKRSISPTFAIHSVRYAMALPLSSSACSSCLSPLTILKESASLSRLNLAIGVVASIAMITVFRYAIARNLEVIVGGNPYRTALIIEDGFPAPARQVSMIIRVSGNVLFGSGMNNPLLYDRLAQSLRGMANVLVACRPDHRAKWAHLLKGANIQSEILAPELDDIAPLGVSRRGGSISLIVAKGPLNFTDRLTKRAFDIAVAGTAIIVLSPILLAIAAAIKLDSPGPYSSGRNGSAVPTRRFVYSSFAA